MWNLQCLSVSLEHFCIKLDFDTSFMTFEAWTQIYKNMQTLLDVDKISGTSVNGVSWAVFDHHFDVYFPLFLNINKYRTDSVSWKYTDW